MTGLATVRLLRRNLLCEVYADSMGLGTSVRYSCTDEVKLSVILLSITSTIFIPPSRLYIILKYCLHNRRGTAASGLLVSDIDSKLYPS